METKLLEARHMSRSKLFYLGFSNFCYTTGVFKMETN